MAKGLKARTKKIAIGIFQFIRILRKNEEGVVFENQAQKPGTSAVENQPSVGTAKSTTDFVNKIVVIEEAEDECCYFELMIEAGISDQKQVENYLKEATELIEVSSFSSRAANQN